ncbi:MAG TPA: glycosyltransferase family 9 protein [Candidatus Eisenbacteria bacterium]|nr:glycosyltransferase family 9 protein [Candidatus Eisenbacteria bacterium]
MTRAQLEPRRLLIILHGAIGDVTRALPLPTLLRRRFPDAFLAWSVEAPCLPLIEGHPALDEVILFDRDHWWRALIPFIRKIRSRRFDCVLDLQRHFKSGAISLLSGARARVGFHPSESKEFNWIFNNRHIAAAGHSISKLDHYLQFAAYLDAPTGPLEWPLVPTAEVQRAFERHLEGVDPSYAVLFAGSRWESKRWFPAQIAECAEAIKEHYGFDVVLLGSRADRAAALEAQTRCRAKPKNLVGQTSLREAVAIISRAKVAVGPDTGLMHIASALAVPVVSLWGATDPARNAPHGFERLAIRGRAECAPCNRRRCPIGRVCMRSIATAEIVEKINEALNGAGALRNALSQT